MKVFRCECNGYKFRGKQEFIYELCSGALFSRRKEA